MGFKEKIIVEDYIIDKLEIKVPQTRSEGGLVLFYLSGTILI